MLSRRLLAVRLLTVGVLVLSGCTGPPSDPGHQRGSADPTPAPVGDLTFTEYATRPIPPQQIDDALAGIDGLVDDVLRRTGVPGLAVGVVHGKEIVYAKGFGVRRKGEPGTVDPDTVFQIASVSKSIGSSCIAKAVSDGVVDWDDPVTQYLPNFRLSDPSVTSQVSIGDLYAHRSGIPGAAGDDLEGLGFDRVYVLSKLREFPLRPFRISYGYTNFGMTAGAEAVAAAARKPWDRLCAETLYGPLGMTSTSSRYADFLTRTNRATIHAKLGDKDFQPKYRRDADAQSPAGGVSSSVNDLARWMIMTLGQGRVGEKQLIEPAVVQDVFVPHVTSAPATTPAARSRFYGYGANVETTSTGHVKWSHSGAFYVGAGTAYALLPAADVGIVVLTNGAPVGAAEAITTGFTDLVRTGTVERDWLAYYGELLGALFVNHSKVAGPPPAKPAPARPLERYVGRYENAYVGTVTVSLRGRELVVSLGPGKLSAPLQHFDGDTFRWFPPGGTGAPSSAVTFAGGGNEPATVSLEYLQIPELRRRE